MISLEYQGAFGMNDAQSLRWSLFTLALATPWAIFHYWRAGVWLKRDGAAGED